MRTLLESHLGPLGLPVVVDKSPTAGGAAADTGVYGPNGAKDVEPATVCGITVYPVADNLGDSQVEGVLAHELGHCFAGRYQGVRSYWAKGRPAWVEEGLPSWMSATALRRVFRGGVFDKWDRSGDPLIALDYAGAGFFGMVADVTSEGALWQRVPSIFRAADDQSAVLVATGSNYPEVADHWGPSHAGRPDLGNSWLRALPLPMDTAGSSTFVGPATSVPVTKQGATLTPAPYTSLLYSIEPTTELFRIDQVGDDARGLFHDGETLQFRAGSPQGTYYCTAAKCECPAGHEGTVPDSTRVRLPLYAGLAGGIRGGSGVRITAVPYDKFCKGRGAIGGTWHGTWASSVYERVHGTFRATLVQTGQHFTGNVDIGGSRCVSGGTTSGHLDGNHIRFSVVQAETAVHYTGTLSGNTMTGTWRASGCANDEGRWSASRQD
jgi:hypothetical protein